MSDAFEDRRKALEEQFFKSQNDKLVAKLKAEKANEQTRDEIRAHTGIQNEKVLDALAALNLGGAAVVVVSAWPLVEVAWADGKVEDREREVVLQQAHNMDVVPGSAADHFLDQLLDEKPDLSWSQLWTEFVQELGKKMSAEDKALLKSEVIGRARTVAESTGGILGIGWKVSSTEAKVLAKLEKAFD